MQADKISLEYRNSIIELDRLHRDLEEIGTSLGLPRRTIFQINLAMEEVFSNIIAHGYADEAEHRIKITVSYHDKTLILRTEDDGIPFNPREAEAPDLECPLEERPIGGLGCHLMKCLMDDIVYERLGNKNILTMKKAIVESNHPV
jgi:serine/threonine-protein kinase RsbW